MLRIACLAIVVLACGSASAQGSAYTLAALSELSCVELNDKIEEGKRVGDAEAFYSAAQLLIRRTCFRYDRTAYVELLRQAVERGLMRAKFDLGYAYALGEGVPQSYQTAGEMVIEAGEPTDRWSTTDPYTIGYVQAFSRLVRRNAVDMPRYVWRKDHLLRVKLNVAMPANVTVAVESAGVPAPDDDQERAEAQRQVFDMVQSAVKQSIKELRAPDRSRLKVEEFTVQWDVQVVAAADRRSLHIERLDNVRPH